MRMYRQPMGGTGYEEQLDGVAQKAKILTKQQLPVPPRPPPPREERLSAKLRLAVKGKPPPPKKAAPALKIKGQPPAPPKAPKALAAPPKSARIEGKVHLRQKCMRRSLLPSSQGDEGLVVCILCLIGLCPERLLGALPVTASILSSHMKPQAVVCVCDVHACYVPCICHIEVDSTQCRCHE